MFEHTFNHLFKENVSPQYKNCMIRAGTTCAVCAFCRTVQSDHPV